MFVSLKQLPICGVAWHYGNHGEQVFPLDPDLGSWCRGLSEAWKGAAIIFIPPFYGGTQRGKGKLSEYWIQEDLAGQFCASRKN